ncbi:chemotaxis protein CheW [Cellulomonas carbonis]|uniref:Chemotaxis protein CheW n=1 Tax=Cellulomonas carbonis T26 TaxID=947969 RepID=A0A0A0BK45_9CELL|nr:chemotaxis protein CheW [Cellulomonas carbonis]KGM08888.1 chemotaxis protein CheW [Cellulomonas carbonis T26]GGC01739.1 chemotaxis protein CheW [Cellulomonas carbonis]
MSRQLATFVLDGARYGVDVLKVQEALRSQVRTPVPLAPGGVAGLVNLRGQVVLTIDLRVRLGLAPLADDAEPMMVVVQVDGEPISLLVDEIGDVIDVDTDQFESPPETLDPSLRDVILGAYKLDTGLLLALDVERATAA